MIEIAIAAIVAVLVYLVVVALHAPSIIGLVAAILILLAAVSRSYGGRL